MSIKIPPRASLSHSGVLALTPVLPLLPFFVLVAALDTWSLHWPSYLALIGIYLLCMGLQHRHYRQSLRRQWQHLDEVIKINEATAELARHSDQYRSEEAFLGDLLKHAVGLIPGAEMGSLIKIVADSPYVRYESAIGMALDKLQSIKLPLEHTFEYKLTGGACDRTLLINDISKINANSPLTPHEQQVLLSCSDLPIRSTLATPIYIDDQLYGMINIDSSRLNAFSEYDKNLMTILTREICNAITMYHQSRRIYELANTDLLTGLYNRKRFEEALLGREGGTLILLDMDNLKQLNDQHGHQAGDKALQQIATTIRETFPPDTMTARFGGDEFMLLTQLPADEQQLASRRLKSRLAQCRPPIFCSMGCAPYQGNLSAAFSQADDAMYQDKKRHKQQLVHPLSGS